MPAYDDGGQVPPSTFAPPVGGDPFLDWYHHVTALGAPAQVPSSLPPVDDSFAGAPDPFAGAPPPPVAPSVELGPQMPTATDGLDGTMFDAAAPPAPPQGDPLDSAGAPPPIPFGAAPASAPPDAPPDAAVLGPQLPTRPVQTPYGWDPLAGTTFETPHIQPGAENPFAGVSDATGYTDARELATRHPEEFLQLQADQLARKQIAASTAQVKADQDNLDSLKADQAMKAKAYAITQAKTDKITADSIALSSKPLDRGRWFRNLSTVGKIAAAIAAVTGGLLTKPGGPNLGLDYVTRNIDDDINDQKADIENGRAGLATRQGAVAQEFARTGNLYEAAETVRLATYQATINKLQTEQQNFDPRGTGYINHGRAIQGMQGQAATAQEALRKTIFDESFKTEQLTNEIQKTTDARWKAQQDVARAGAASKADKQQFTPDQLSILNPGLPVPPIPMTLVEHAKWLGTQKVGEEYKTAARANDPNERNRELSVPGVVDDKGKSAHFRDAAVAKEAAASLGVADDLVRMTDELIGMVEKSGYSTDFVRGKEWQKAQQTYAALLLTAKERDHLGALSGSDIELEQKKIGSSDPTQIRGTIDGMRQFRHNTIEAINSTFRNSVYLPEGSTLKRWDPKPVITEAPTSAKLSGKTLSEHVDEAAPGGLTKAATLPGVRDALSVLPGYAAPEDWQSNAANTPVGPTGLALEDTTKVGGAIQAYATAPRAAQDAIVDQLRVWASSDRPSVTTGVLGLVQGDNPALYERVLSQMPADVQKQRREFDAVRAGFPGAQLPPLKPNKRVADSPRGE